MASFVTRPRRRSRSRSRSPRPGVAALSLEARETWLASFARVFWAPPDGPDAAPWLGQRAELVRRFRERLVTQAEDAACLEETDEEGLELVGRPFARLSEDTIYRWQRFTFYEDLARMSDVLFRGPIEPRHVDDVDFRLFSAWRRLRNTIDDQEEFMRQTADFRVSAVRVSMMLESSRPSSSSVPGPGAGTPSFCGEDDFDLPEARTLAALLLMRCEKDDAQELVEMYRLLCHKLSGCGCAWCARPFDEGSSAGLFDGEEMTFPAQIPKVLVPQCGHAIHTLCFGSQLVPDRHMGERGFCRRCGESYGWSTIDVDPMVNAFVFLFGPYVEKRISEMVQADQVDEEAVVCIAEVCQSFAFELNGFISSSTAWQLLSQRHTFSNVFFVNAVGERVVQLLTPAAAGEPPAQDVLRRAGQPLLHPGEATVICPEDRDDELASCCSTQSEGEQERRKHLTEVFLPDPESEQEPEPGVQEPGSPHIDPVGDSPFVGFVPPHLVLCGEDDGAGDAL